MSPRFGHRVFSKIRPGYPARMKRLCDKLGGYRVEEHIGWTERVEAWLSNFEGLEDQELALSMVERLRVVSHNEVIHGCKALYDRIKAASPGDDARLHHFAHETSGAALLRSLEKKIKVRRFTILRPKDFVDLSAAEKLREGDSIIVWDTFLGTGGQLTDQIKMYRPLFAAVEGRSLRLHFAFLAGHAPPTGLSLDVSVHRWVDDVPVISDRERDLCSRYEKQAGASKTNTTHETGALITLPDNPPNNVPLVLRARAQDIWFTLLDRDDTATP